MRVLLFCVNGRMSGDSSKSHPFLLEDGMRNKKVCPICNKAFEVHVNGALTKYCSQDCADEARRIKNREYMRKVNPQR